jgi:4'-phosphopantetheinyl transferase
MASARAAPPLRPVDLHVWHGTLDLSASVVTGLRDLLAADERERADRFRFERDRSRYIAGRGQLRLLLGRYLGTRAEAIRFRYGHHGKPELAGAELAFNVTHSGPYLLIAVSREAELGIDVERQDQQLAQECIAEHFFAPGEVAELRGLPLELQSRAFLACWTRKEAFIKARGDGLSLALDSFDVSLAPGKPVALLRTAWSPSEPTEWSLIDLSNVDAGYVAAVAVHSAAALDLTLHALPDIEETVSEKEAG